MKPSPGGITDHEYNDDHMIYMPHMAGLIEVVNAMSPAGTKIAILYCETGFTPTAARTAFCNDNKNATGFAARLPARLRTVLVR